MNKEFLNHLSQQCTEIAQAGLSKNERIISSSQQAHISLANGTF